MAITIISLIKQVPLPSEMRMNEEGLMDRTKAKSIINIDCSFGLEAGLQLKQFYPDAKMIVCSMGPKSFEASLRKALSMGYDDAFLLSDRKLGGSDTYATGLAIANMLKYLGFTKDAKDPFIIVAGRQTSDGDTAHVPSQVAANIEIPQATFVETIEPDNNNVIVKRIIEGGHQIMRLPLPCLVSLTPTGIPPRKPTLSNTIKARKSEITVLSLDDIGMSTDKIGLSGSPTIVSNVVNMVSERPPVIMCNGDNESEKIVKLFTELEQHKKEVKVQDNKVVSKETELPDFKTEDIRGEYKGILTWAEIAGDDIARSSLEILTPALKLAHDLGNNTKITTLIIGDKLSEKAKLLIEHGADEVITVENPKLKDYLVLPFTSIFTQVIKERKPEIVLFGATTSGRELAPRIAVNTGSGVTADCTKLEIGEYINRKEKTIIYPILQSHRPTYGESKLATILGFVFPQISTARPGTFEIPLSCHDRKGIITEFKPILSEDDFKTTIIETVRGDNTLQNLFNAEVIVSGGRGAIEDNFALIRQLTDVFKRQGINAEWASSRVAVDEGFAEYARQVGQTGKTVRPKIYIAIGISGAIQHIAGIKEAEIIIAIDHNAKAPIFRYADFGIVGEYKDILPELIDKVNSGAFKDVL